jgi:hypothetical protein
VRSASTSIVRRDLLVRAVAVGVADQAIAAMQDRLLPFE